MRVTKYPQSCLIIEVKDKRILIDPGSLLQGKYTARDLVPVDYILITHEHSDHLDLDLLNDILQIKKVPVIANQSTKNLVGDVITKVVKDKEVIKLDTIKIQARELSHVLMINGDSGPQNTGYVIEDTFFHAGDGVFLEDFVINNAAIPIAGPDLSPKDVFDFINQIGCKNVIPIHYDFFGANPEMLNNRFFFPNVNAIILQNGESVDI